MATTDTATTKRKPAARRKPAATAKRSARTTRSVASSSTRPATRTARVQQLAERAVLIPLGAALEARDRVGELVSPYRSRTGVERQLTRFERRGGRARTQLEREVRRTRTRLERETRNARRGVDRRRSALGANVEGMTSRVENVVQNGLETGRKLVNGAQERIKSAA